MAKASCPLPEQLEQFLLGQLPEPQAEGLAQHLGLCDPCLRTVEGLRVDDTLLRELQHGVGMARQAAQAVQQELMERVQALARPDKPHDLKEASTQPHDTPAPCQPVTGSVASGASLSPGVTFAFLAPAQAADEIGRLGPYRVLKMLGQGGMGVVFRAEDVRLHRPVALKVMLPELAQKPGARERFLREARAVAALEHDNIVAIHQVDEDRGVPYLAMPLLKGKSLEDLLKQKPPGVGGTPLTLAQILKIGSEIARGLNAAHQRGLIHRDIKPGNIWLDATASDRVKLLDFGLARSTSGEQKLTQPGAIVGTPAYMAPEQAQGQKLDGRADLFSLGVVLYRLCTGELPFYGPDMISTLMALATHEPLPPGHLNPDLPPALSDLIMKLLAKDPVQRPGSAEDVATALQAIDKNRGLEHTPAILAAVRSGVAPTRPPRRWWPVVAATTALLVLPLVLYVVATALRVDTDPPAGKPSSGIESLSANPVGHVAPRPPSNYVVFTLKAHKSGVLSVAFSPDGRRLVSGSIDGTIKVWNATTGQDFLTLKGHTLGVSCVAFSPDGKRLASGSYDKTLKVWDATTGQDFLTLKGHTLGVSCVAFSPDGERLVSGSEDKTLKVWDATTGKEILILTGHTDFVTGVAFSPDGKRLVSGSWDRTVKVWDATTGQQPFTLKGHRALVSSVAFSPDGKRLVSGSWDHTVKVWDVWTGQHDFTVNGHTDKLCCVAFSSDGKRLVSSSWDQTVKVWDAHTGREALTLTGHTGRVWSVAFSSDGKRLVSGGDDGTVRLWDVSGLAAPAVLPPPIGVEVDNLAPDIHGEDVDGKRFKLSDYRGKVVFLDFWGDWCPFCRRMLPYKRALVKRAAGKPLAVLGVNYERHHDRALAKRVMQREQITWPNWWPPPPGGSALRKESRMDAYINKEWQVEGFPLLYVLDHKGVIRWRCAGALDAQGCAELDQRIDRLVADCERETKAAGPR